MENVKSTTARLRRTFHYPEEDSTDSQPEALDEQEQEDLIKTLAAENAVRNAQFRRALVALPLVATLPYVPSLFAFGTSLLALLSITSLLSTAYLLCHLPPGESGIAAIDVWSRPKTPHPSRHPSASPLLSLSDDDDDDGYYGAAGPSMPRSRRITKRPRRSSFSYEARKSPLELYLPYLNMGLGLVLVLLGWAVGSTHRRFAWIGMGYLPLFVNIVVLIANMVMAGVDPEKELSALKYDYKGA